MQIQRNNSVEIGFSPTPSLSIPELNSPENNSTSNNNQSTLASGVFFRNQDSDTFESLNSPTIDFLGFENRNSQDTNSPTLERTDTEYRDEVVSLPAGFNPASVLNSIKTEDYPEYLNLPNSIENIAFLDISTVMLPFGDKTGIQKQVSYFAVSAVYQRLQEINAARAYLNSSTGLKPNAGISYIPGRPPYGQETDPKWRAAHEEVFKLIRREINNQLAVIADRLNTQLQIHQQSATLAQTFEGNQNQTMSGLIQGFAPQQGGR